MFFLVLHVILGITLLANVSFTSTWREIHQFPLLGSGISPINATIATNLGSYCPIHFWPWFYGLLGSPNYATYIPPIHCSGVTNCSSYFLPGSVYDITFPQSFNATSYPEATALVVQNSVGYQIEYYSLSSSDDFNGAECKVYGYDYPEDSVGILLCLKQSGNDLLAGAALILIFLMEGFSVCPSPNISCLSDAPWQKSVTIATKVTISERVATIVYSQINNTIIDVYDVGPPQATNYSPGDFFPIYDMATNYTTTSTGLDYLYYVAGQIPYDTSYDAAMQLRQFIAVPVGIFNNVEYGLGYPEANLQSTGILSTPTYRVR